MTIWSPELGERAGPRYRAIADALARDIADGRLTAGTRLPTQRELATHLGVTVGTVSRAYGEAERLGLISGEVGRGTFVRDQGFAPLRAPRAEGEEPDCIDLSQSFAGGGAPSEELRRTLTAVAAHSDLAEMLGYRAPAGAARHRAAGARWVLGAGLEAESDEIVVTSGAQHGMSIALSSLAQPGDTLLTGALSYPGTMALARLLRLNLVGVALDAQGLRPDALETACRAGRARAVHVMPNLHNPTAAVMSEVRRREVVDVARRHDLAILEDDISGFLGETALPLSRLAPERGYYITSLSKCVAPGLRVGYLRAPPDAAARVAACLRTQMWMAPPLMAEIATEWIEDGTAVRLARERSAEAAERTEIARRHLEGLSFDAPRASFYLWLRLPEPWRAEQFCAQARSRGVLVTPAEAFAVGRTPAPHAIRICTSAPDTRDDLEQGMTRLVRALEEPPESVEGVI